MTLAKALHEWKMGRDTASGFYKRVVHEHLIMMLCKGGGK